MKPGTRLGPAPRLEKTSRPRPKRQDPHSPWQIMVDDRMREMGIASRALASKISTPQRSISHSTLWAWTRNIDGYPPHETYTEAVNRRLANALNIKPEILAKAYEDSRRKLLIADPNAAEIGKLSVLRRLFADSKQDRWSREEIVKLIDDLSGR